MLRRYTLAPMQHLWLREETKFEHWLDVELAAMRARVALGELPHKAYEAVEALRSAAAIDVERIKELEQFYRHDLVAFVAAIQELLTARGQAEAGAQFHKPLTSYDVEDPALILMLREATRHIREEFQKLETALRKLALEHKWTIMIGRTHGQYAEPTTFGCLLMVYRSEMGRNIRRLTLALEFELNEGKMSGAVGSFAGIDPELERIALGYLGLEPARAETQILQRDRHAMLLAIYAVCAGTIEQMCRTFWELMRSEVRELKEPRTEAQRGSSAMPWKENPILTEQLQGLARLVRAYAHAAQENIATPEWRDISQSSVERHIFPDASAILYYMAVKATWLVQNLVVFPERMEETLLVKTRGVWAGQRIRDALTDLGIAPDLAYTFTRQAAFDAVGREVYLRDILASRELAWDRGRATVAALLGPVEFEQCFDAVSYIKSGVEHIFREEEESR